MFPGGRSIKERTKSTRKDFDSQINQQNCEKSDSSSVDASEVYEEAYSEQLEDKLFRMDNCSARGDAQG